MDPVYGSRSPEELRTLAAVGSPARRRAIQEELAAREAENVAANLAAAATDIPDDPTFGGDDGWQRWVDETPGSERQARYNPEGYEAFREGEREDIRQRALEDMETYGMGPEAGLTQDQQQARMDRRYAEDKQRHLPFAEEQRIARMAASAGLTMAEARAMVNAGYQRAGDERGLHKDSRWVAGGQNDSVPPDFGYFRDAYQELRDKGRDRRAADLAARKAEVSKRAQLMLNPVAYLGREDITPEQRQFVTDRMKPPSRQSGDPRVRVAEIGAASAEAQAAAEREARISQQQWLETTRIGAEERAAERARYDAERTRAFDAEQRQLDREARAAEGNVAREAAYEQRQADLEARRQEHEQVLKRMDAQDANAARRHEEAQTEARGRYGLDERRLDDAKKAEEERMRMAEREALLRSMEGSYGPGVRALAEGDYEAPESQESLREMARASDQTWLGFWEDDGRRMDAILSRLGVSDPATRRQLVERFGYGLENDFLGAGGDGRGGMLSYWMAGRPW